MNQDKFIDNYFKILVLLFWPIIWYKYSFLPNKDTDIFMFSAFTLISILYIISLTFKTKNLDKIVFIYRLTTIVTFVLFLLGYLIFPKNIALFTLKLICLVIYFYISYLMNFKFKNNEGVVGILSSLLLLTITFSY